MIGFVHRKHSKRWDHIQALWQQSLPLWSFLQKWDDEILSKDKGSKFGKRSPQEFILNRTNSRRAWYQCTFLWKCWFKDFWFRGFLLSFLTTCIICFHGRRLIRACELLLNTVPNKSINKQITRGTTSHLTSSLICLFQLGFQQVLQMSLGDTSPPTIRGHHFP